MRKRSWRSADTVVRSAIVVRGAHWSKPATRGGSLGRRCYRESSQIQFTSQIFPPSGEKDCSMRAELGEMLSQT
jgi:hypothetical protein